MDKEKILLYKAESCTRCPIAKFILNRVLLTKGLSYSEIVQERDTEKDSDALAELLMLNSVNTPVLVAGNVILREEEALKERLVKEAVEKWLSAKASRIQ